MILPRPPTDTLAKFATVLGLILAAGPVSYALLDILAVERAFPDRRAIYQELTLDLTRLRERLDILSMKKKSLLTQISELGEKRQRTRCPSQLCKQIDQQLTQLWVDYEKFTPETEQIDAELHSLNKRSIQADAKSAAISIQIDQHRSIQWLVNLSTIFGVVLFVAGLTQWVIKERQDEVRDKAKQSGEKTYKNAWRKRR